MKSINKILIKIKHEIKLEYYKQRKHENDLDLKTKMPKCMTNASFYMPKRTIHLDFQNPRYGLNTEKCLGCRTDSNFSFDAKIWTPKWQN